MSTLDLIQQKTGIGTRVIVTLLINFVQGTSNQLQWEGPYIPLQCWELTSFTCWAEERSRAGPLRGLVQWLLIIKYRFSIILTTDVAVLVEAAEYLSWMTITPKVAPIGIPFLGRGEVKRIVAN